MHLHIGGIEQHEPVIGIVEREAVFHEIEGGAQHFRVPGLIERALKSPLALLDGGDVGPEPDEHAVIQAAVAQMHPPSVVEPLFELGVRLPIFLQPLPHPAAPLRRPRGALGARSIDEPAVVIGAREQVAKPHARLGHIAEMGIEFGHAAVRQQEPVLLVVDDDAGVERFEHRSQKILRLLELAAHLVQRVLRGEKVRNVSARALIARKGALLVEDRIARNGKPAAMGRRVRHFVHELAKRAMRLQIVEMRPIFLIQAGSHRKEIEPGPAERLSRLHPSGRFDTVGKMDEGVAGVGSPYPVGADLEKPAEVGGITCRPMCIGSHSRLRRIILPACAGIRKTIFFLFFVLESHRTRPRDKPRFPPAMWTTRFNV